MLDVHNLSAAYGQSEVLHNVDFSVAPGEIVAVVGRNGMGKSTLMKSLIGIIPPRSGEVKVDGKDVSTLASHARVADFWHHDGAREHRDRPGGDGKDADPARDLRPVPDPQGIREAARRQSL